MALATVRTDRQAVTVAAHTATRCCSHTDCAHCHAMRCCMLRRQYGDPMPEADAVALIKAVYDAGITFWDSAEAYKCQKADGSTLYNESVLGTAIKSLGLPREELQLATKYMPSFHGDTMTPETCLAAAKASCDRLGVESLDLYYVHRFHSKVPVQEQAQAMLAVKEAGLAKCIGVSEFAPRSLREFHAICPVTCIQNEWSLLNRDLEAELVPTCRELGIGIVACE
jgi:aryl-alcohol dehydrogenase-like predicted oxidoreductase